MRRRARVAAGDRQGQRPGFPKTTPILEFSGAFRDQTPAVGPRLSTGLGIWVLISSDGTILTNGMSIAERPNYRELTDQRSSGESWWYEPPHRCGGVEDRPRPNLPPSRWGNASVKVGEMILVAIGASPWL